MGDIFTAVGGTLAALAWGNARCTRLGERSLHSLGGTLAALAWGNARCRFFLRNPERVQHR